ncbi:MAG: hypothetical protein II304_07330 [Bacteroidales bacterium]|nr:hypothetical protein [Bacteroidales bacterium]
MERKTFTTTIDESLQNRFKAKCAEKGIKMNELLEVFMQMYSEERFELVLKLNNERTIVEK